MQLSKRTRIAAAVLGILAAAAIPGCGDDVTPPDPVTESGEFGSLLDAAEYAAAPRALPPAALAQPPGQAIHPQSAMLSNLPAIAMQGTLGHLGSPGTCEAQSFGYGLGSYTAARAPDGSVKWDAGLPGNEVSAAFQFALATAEKYAGPCPKGGKALIYLEHLAGPGSPTATDVPYPTSNQCPFILGIDVNARYADTARMRIGSFATFQIDPQSNPESLQRIQEFLAKGQAVAFSGTVYQGYGSAGGPPLTDGYFYRKNLTASGGHGQLLVGYDNNLGATGFPKGMLLVQNSFGPQWPSADSKAPRGMLYWSYETFLNNQKLAAVAYPHDPSPPRGTMLAPTTPGAPVASIERAYQWSPAGGATYLILINHIAEPINITTVSLKEPAPGTATASGVYGHNISSGYTYFKRSDGKEFLPGNYTLRIAAKTLAGAAIGYEAVVAVGHALPVTPPAASMTADNAQIVDTTGATATITQ